MDLERAYTSARPVEGPLTAALLAHVVQLAPAFAILDRSGAAPGRVTCLALLAGIYGVGAVHRAARAPRGAAAWRAAGLAATATGTYQIGFAWLGAASSAPLDALDGLALVLCLAGASFGLAAERFRDRFHALPGHAARLCTGGPYALVRYPRYLGDLTWAAGWALATRAGAAWLVVGAHAAILALVYAPALDRRLAARHGAAYAEWAERTRRLVPLVY